MLGDLPQNVWHIRRLTCEGIAIGTQEVNEHAFLFGRELGPHPHGLGRVVGVNLNRLGLSQAEGAG
jgi:hypothetical protein